MRYTLHSFAYWTSRYHQIWDTQEWRRVGDVYKDDEAAARAHLNYLNGERTPSETARLNYVNNKPKRRCRRASDKSAVPA